MTESAREEGRSGTVGELVTVRRHPTVVRLSHLRDEDSDWITEAFCLTQDVEKHLAALSRLLSRDTGTGIFLVGPYGSGKTHFLAYLTRVLGRGGLVEDPPSVRSVSLLNFASRTPLEEVIGELLGIPKDDARGDRRLRFGEAIDGYPKGILLLIDELSEFLQSKPDTESRNEDIRFLQFLGEWASGSRLVVLGAVQEQVEHVGGLDSMSYRKIKDRFPVRMILSSSHLADLIAGGIVVKRKGFDAAFEKLLPKLQPALGGKVDAALLRKLYPVHPGTLDLLSEVRDGFSQARGAVDFVSAQLRGDPGRGITPLLDEPSSRLLTPDRIVDHFFDVFELQPEFQPLSRCLFPYYEQEMERLFPEPGKSRLAWRLLKLLVLYYLVPDRDRLTPKRAVTELAIAASRLQPERNAEITDGILRRMADSGRFVAASGEGFRLALDDDGTAMLDRLVEREAARFADADQALFDLLAAELMKESPGGFHPLALPLARWQPRSLLWCHHSREYAVYVGDGEPQRRQGTCLVVRLPFGDRTPDATYPTLVPAALPSSAELRELGALLGLRGRPLGRAVAEKIEKRIEPRLKLFLSSLRDAYARGVLEGVGPVAGLLPPEGSFQGWIDSIVRLLLRRTYPAFERFAPTTGPLPRKVFRAYVRHLSSQGIEGEEAGDAVGLVREAYLVPMGLIERRGRSYRVSQRLERNELVRQLLPLVANEAPPRLAYGQLALPIYGLVQDQVHLLLVFLWAQGELDLVKGSRGYKECFESLPLPSLYDRLVPAKRFTAEELAALGRLCGALSVRTPGKWSGLSAGRALEELGRRATERAAFFREFRLRLDRLGEAGDLLAELDKAAGMLSLLSMEGNPEAGFRRLLAVVPSVKGFAALVLRLSDSPEQVERRLAERARLRHLYRYQGRMSFDGEVSLGEAPGIDDPDGLKAWLLEATEWYATYCGIYREAHDRYWNSVKGKAKIGDLPSVAASRHVGLAQVRKELERLRAETASLICRGLSSLRFEPVCSCGFDGKRSKAWRPIEELSKRFVAAKREVELFFARPEVKSRMADWPTLGLKMTTGTSDYLAGKAPWPDIQEIDLLDRHLAGIELVKEVDVGELLELLSERTWSGESLAVALSDWLSARKLSRFRFRAWPAAGGEEELARFCLRHCLMQAEPLPPGLPDLTAQLDQVVPAWLGSELSQKLPSLAFPQPVEDRILSLWMSGAAPLEKRPGLPPLVRAVAELRDPSIPTNPLVYSAVMVDLYTSAVRLLPLAGKPYRRLLERYAKIRLDPSPKPLGEVLKDHGDAVWLVIDAFGVMMLGCLRKELADLFPARRERCVAFAGVSPRSTTSAFYDELVKDHPAHAFFKVNGLDELIHERKVPFADLCRLAAAEVAVAIRKLLCEIDPRKPLVVFGDHGFRLAGDGSSYRHGGDSTIERTVPLIVLDPS